MVYIDRSLAAVVQLKHMSVPVVPPPGAQLPVPAAGQWVKQFRVLHADHGKEVLVAEVASKAVLVGQLGYIVGLQKPVVESRGPHGSQVQQHYTTVETWETVRRRVAHFGLGFFFTILPECVSVEKKDHSAVAF